MRTLLLISSLVLALSACAPADPISNEVERVPLGKADAVGSCDLGNNGNACGGPAAIGNCWCDDECEFYGDCCSDKAQLCDGGFNLCDFFSGPCQSDSDCGDGFECGIDPTTCSPSSCGCAPDTGNIICTKDCGGSECIPTETEPDLCEDFVGPCQADSDCGDGFSCIVDSSTCSPSACGCDPATGNASFCTSDCGGGECVEDTIVVCPLIMCFPQCEFGVLQGPDGCDTCECAPAPECETAFDCFNDLGAPTIECVGAHWECNSDSECQQSC